MSNSTCPRCNSLFVSSAPNHRYCSLRCRYSPEHNLADMLKKLGPDDCWEFQGHRNPQGYGKFGFRKSCWQAHRVAYTLAKGEIPPGLDVLHTCDNPPCCNPDHLYVGTDADNTRDKIARNRLRPRKGERHGMHKMTETEARTVIAELGAGTPGRILARKYGVTDTAISLIKRGINWRHLREDATA